MSDFLFIQKIDYSKLKTICEEKYKSVEYSDKTKKHSFVNVQQCALSLLANYELKHSGISTELKMQDCGRLIGANMLAYMKSDYKHWLLDEYVDFDIYNASYGVFVSLAKQYNVECRYLEDYYRNRHKYLRGSETKKSFNIKLFDTHKHVLKNTIEDDIKRLYDVLRKVPKYSGIHTVLKKDKLTNIQGKFMSRVYFMAETEIFNAVIKHIVKEYPTVFGDDFKNGFECIPEFDGFYLRKENLLNDEEEPQHLEFLQWLNESLVSVVPQWNIRFCIKEHNPNLDIELHCYDCQEDTLIVYIEKHTGTKDLSLLDHGERNEWILAKNIADENRGTLLCQSFQREGGTNKQVFWYIFTHRWEQSETKVVEEVVRTTLHKYHKDLQDIKFVVDTNEKLVEAAEKVYNNIARKLSTVSGVNSVIKAMQTYLTDNSIEWDTQRYLLGFENGVWDNNNKVFRLYTIHDYVTFSTGYDFETVYDGINWIDEKGTTHNNKKKEAIEEIKELDDFLNKMCGINNKKDKERKKELHYLLSVYASGFTTERLHKFFIWSGCGSNCKSCVNALIEAVYGSDYFYTAPNTMLTEKVKSSGSCNPAIAGCDKKRIVNTSETEACERILNSIMKLLTGSSTVNARKAFSNITKTTLMCVLILECNHLALLKEDATEADIRRIVQYTFKSMFTSKETENSLKRIYKPVYVYDTDAWRNKVKNVMMNRLILANIQNDKKNLDDIVPQCVIEDSAKYIKSSSHILQNFDTIYEEAEDNKVDIPLSNAVSKIYNILFQKNKNTAINFSKLEIDNKLRERFTIDHRPSDTHHKNYIMGYKKRETNETYV
jgi:phage/plasmid-associated DNA primase